MYHPEEYSVIYGIIIHGEGALITEFKHLPWQKHELSRPARV